MKLDFNKVRMFEFKYVSDIVNCQDFLSKHPELLNDDTYLYSYEELYYYKIQISPDELMTIPTRKFKMLSYDFNCAVNPGGRINEI